VHTGITNSPSDEWTAQQLREATPWGKGPKYLIHDRDSKYVSHFSAVAASSGIKEEKNLIECHEPMAFAKGLWAACDENAWIIFSSMTAGICNG
jgi:hypothetical protein